MKRLLLWFLLVQIGLVLPALAEQKPNLVKVGSKPGAYEEALDKNKVVYKGNLVQFVGLTYFPVGAGKVEKSYIPLEKKYGQPVGLTISESVIDCKTNKIMYLNKIDIGMDKKPLGMAQVPKEHQAFLQIPEGTGAAAYKKVLCDIPKKAG